MWQKGPGEVRGGKYLLKRQAIKSCPVCLILQERNQQIFEKTITTPSMLAKQVVQEVQIKDGNNKIYKIKRSPLNMGEKIFRYIF